MLKVLKPAALLIGLSLVSNAMTCTPDGKDGIVPENDMYLPTSYKSINGGLNQDQFNKAIDRVIAIYEPIITNMGAKLVVDRKWDDGTVNAYASQSGKTWNVAMFGGLARHETITEDGMSLVVCHEIGHHIGGAPKKAGWFGSSWASNEGQADYFATLKCLRKTFLNDDNQAIVAAMEIPAALKEACAKSTRGNAEDNAICIRASMAGKSVSDLFSVLSKLPETKFDTPDAKVVTKTDDNHPKAQCRLDTYFQGSLCDVGMNEDVSQTDEVKGTCHPSLNFEVGKRPLCWFKPKM